MQKKIWDYIAWIVLILLAVWIILKVMGIINTPLWLQYSPLFGALYLAGWAMSKLDRATDDIREMKKEVNSIWNDTKNIESDIDILRKKCPELK